MDPYGIFTPVFSFQKANVDVTCRSQTLHMQVGPCDHAALTLQMSLFIPCTSNSLAMSLNRLKGLGLWLSKLAGDDGLQWRRGLSGCKPTQSCNQMVLNGEEDYLGVN